MKTFTVFTFLIALLSCSWTLVSAQKKQILIDVSHGQKFYSDPADKLSSELVPTDRLHYMTGELAKNGAAHNAEIGYLKTRITSNALSECDLLFIHVPPQNIPRTNAKRSGNT